MTGKRSRASADDGCDSNSATLSTTAVRPTKRIRQASTSNSQYNLPLPKHSHVFDHLSHLSDELLVRVLGHLTAGDLLAISPVSRRFHRLADDSQLWKALYYERFVLPRALRIPGLRGGPLPATGADGVRKITHKLHLSGRRIPRAGGWQGSENLRNLDKSSGTYKKEEQEENERHTRWKRQYKLRHNWARGSCAVEELSLGGNSDTCEGAGVHCGDSGQMLVKVADGIAVTADRRWGLRVWDLKSRSMIASANLGREKSSKEHRETKRSTTQSASVSGSVVPTSLAVEMTAARLDIAIGLLDGGFDIWQLDVAHAYLHRRFTHAASTNGALIAIAYSHPFVLTATESVLVSLYVFSRVGSPSSPSATWPPPSVLTSLRSHTSRPPLALSIRKLASVTIASIAYTLSTRQGWSIGIQDLHVDPWHAEERSKLHTALPQITTTRLACTQPVSSERAIPHIQPPELNNRLPRPTGLARHAGQPPHNTDSHLYSVVNNSHPTTLCYTHPYLLATLPDNTLVLHLCTSSATSLAISPGIRLWGHTSGIGDAEITSRGKAVSISTRGDEMRVWELEGVPSAERGRSVAIRPSRADAVTDDDVQAHGDTDTDDDYASVYDWAERRNWVGFDEEMVIVLKESREGGESLMVYDFS